MSMSGIEVDDECKQVFDSMKLAKKGHERRKVSGFTISDDGTKVVVDESLMTKTSHFSRDLEHDRQSFDDLKAILKSDYCQKASYLLLDFNFRDPETQQVHEKLAYIYWCPESCKIKEKMVFAATNETVKQKFKTNIAIECHDESDLDYTQITDALKKRK